jgi:hypothetical protein
VSGFGEALSILAAVSRPSGGEPLATLFTNVSRGFFYYDETLIQQDNIPAPPATLACPPTPIFGGEVSNKVAFANNLRLDFQMA